MAQHQKALPGFTCQQTAICVSTKGQSSKLHRRPNTCSLVPGVCVCVRARVCVRGVGSPILNCTVMRAENRLRTSHIPLLLKVNFDIFQQNNSAVPSESLLWLYPSVACGSKSHEVDSGTCRQQPAFSASSHLCTSGCNCIPSVMTTRREMKKHNGGTTSAPVNIYQAVTQNLAVFLLHICTFIKSTNFTETTWELVAEKNLRKRFTFHSSRGSKPSPPTSLSPGMYTCCTRKDWGSFRCHKANFARMSIFLCES